MTAWQPIETAPKDGNSILAWCPRIMRCVEVWWEQDDYEGGGYWQDDGDTEPFLSHWMPLPEPPNGE